MITTRPTFVKRKINGQLRLAIIFSIVARAFVGKQVTHDKFVVMKGRCMARKMGFFVDFM